MLEKNFKYFFFFFSQLIELFHRTMKKKSKIQITMNYSYPNLDLVLMIFVTSCGAERVKVYRLVCHFRHCFYL